MKHEYKINSQFVTYNYRFLAINTDSLERDTSYEYINFIMVAVRCRIVMF